MRKNTVIYYKISMHTGGATQRVIGGLGVILACEFGLGVNRCVREKDDTGTCVEKKYRIMIPALSYEYYMDPCHK